MRIKITTIYSLLLCMLFWGCKSSPESTEQLFVTPKPAQINWLEGTFIFNAETQVVAVDDEVQQVADFFREQLKERLQIQLETVSQKPTKNYIQLRLDATGDTEEGYQLHIIPQGIEVTAKTPNGIFYGLQSLTQLVLQSENNKNNFSLPSMTIKDTPRFSWRGFHLDVSRHFFSVDFIKKQLDLLALFKVNKFHWHLTDDQGWRIEIKKYPKLTSIGSKRKEADGSIHQGYYTQEEIKEVVQYAKERFIDVIPEFDTPGHAIAILAAYPELSCEENTYEVRNLWGVESNILCAGKEQTYTFIADVIEELVTLFPYQYYHMGGDEVPKDKWADSADCQAMMKREGLEDEKALQSYFMARVEKILAKHQKKMIGWDEILEGGITPTTTIMSWQGEEGGIKAANQGHDVVMSPISYVYFNFYQGDHHAEPLAFGGYIPLEKVYNYNPIPSEINKDKQKHILGSQGNLWTEYAKEEATVEYLLYPRIIALAETNWTPLEQKEYSGFLERMAGVYNVLDKYNVNYHIPLPEGPKTNQIVFTDSVQVPFTTTRSLKMVYTTDGKTPNVNSAIYKDTLIFTENTTLKIASISEHNKISPIRTIQLSKEEAMQPVVMKQWFPGLQMTSIPGHFQNLAEIDFNNGSDAAIVAKIEDANTTYHWGHEIKEENFKAVQLDGYIEVPEDGVYYFASAQEQVWVGGRLVVDHNAVIRKHEQVGAIALEKGKHALKIIYLNNVVNGWASDWNTVTLQYRKAEETEYKTVSAEMLFHPFKNELAHLKKE